MKKTLLIIPLALLVSVSSACAELSFVISNDDDTLVSSPAQSPTSSSFVKSGFRSLYSLQIAAPLGQDALYVCSGPASTSPSTAVYRANSVAGMFGVTVPTDRNTDPAAWYWIPTLDMAPLGLQWFDPVTTPFHSFKGATTLTNQLNWSENGHRIVVNTVGTSPISAYTLTVSSSLTNIPSVTFGIATNTTTGGEIPFNPQFVGEYWGSDGIRQSQYSVPQGRDIAGGDDVVFDAGQLPSTNTYSAFVRFGATISIGASTPADMEAFRASFNSGNQWILIELRKNGVLVASKYVSSATPKALISKSADSSTFTLSVQGGQENSPYSIENRTNLVNDVWKPFMPGVTINSGNAQTFPNTQEMEFFRLLAR
ncbi:MAG: hypothetical protein RLY66_145 [Candidatus Parcubacteria bacterium]|jgi:hypothetical protein